MKWSEDYATGVERIDEQHKMLFQMVEDFGTALDQGQGQRVYQSFLESLDLYARSHFRYEEGCMVKCHCPAAEGNKTAHDRFMAMLIRFTQRHASNGYDAGDARELTDTIDRWLADHICRIDVQLRDYV
jgi:hemerythrin